MSNVVPPSFFPTAKEVSNGLQWFKEHPILAAAAATAVSVITYLHTAEDVDVDVDGTLGDLLDHENDQDDHSQLQSSPSATSLSPQAPRRHASSPTIMLPAHDTTTRPSPPPALRKPGSEGKMSPAAVTWVDEHGGSLTEVFEHLTITSDSEEHDEFHSNERVYPDLDGPLRSLATGRRPPTTPRHNGKTLEDELLEVTAPHHDQMATSPSSGHWMGRFGVQSPQVSSLAVGERQTESPQWGWYVPITPPQDLESSLPRAIGTPSQLSQSTSVPRPELSSMMRRSMSGRIKAT